jgi:hypothetical protein
MRLHTARFVRLFVALTGDCRADPWFGRRVHCGGSAPNTVSINVRYFAVLPRARKARLIQLRLWENRPEGNSR